MVTILGVVTFLWMVPLKEDNSSRDDNCPGMFIVLEIEIIKGKETVIWRMTFLGMVAVLGIALVLRIGDFLVMVRAVS